MSLADRLARALASHAAGALYAADDFAREAAAPDPVPAAVLIAAVDRAEPGLILTRRHDGLRSHAGQIAFPGGRLDPGDADAVAGALREAEEEIALPAAAATVVAVLDPFETITGYRIVPVLATIPPDLPLRPRAGEVDACFEVPLRFVLDPANRIERVGHFQGHERRYSEIIWGERRIWGATAAIIANLAHRLGPAW